MRIVTAAVALLSVVVGTGAASAGSEASLQQTVTSVAGLPPPVLARTFYAVTPDPRLCPSPMCGGYWAAKANHARTRCHDGLLRPRCYIATVLSATTREPLSNGLPGGSLVRAAMGSTAFPGFGELGLLTVAEVWTPVGKTRVPGGYYRVRDTGIRCIRAPCFSFRAVRLERGSSFLVSGLELGAAHPTEGDAGAAQRALAGSEGLLVLGKVAKTADGGRTLLATRFFLRAPPPRA